MGKIIKLSESGETFIRSICNGNGTAHVSGGASYVLPYCTPKSTLKVWTSNQNINGGIETDGQLADALIRLYNKYGELYSIDPNIMVAQAHTESGLYIWNYAPNSTASGISQFIVGTIHELIISNNRGEFSNAERQAITKNINGYTFTSSTSQPKDPFLVNNELGRQNREQLHQNTIDNLEIMIKAQFVYMRFISSRCDGLASSALFGYNRGPYYVKGTSYVQAITTAKNVSVGYEKEGIDYVYKIFKLLYTRFGIEYAKLNITQNGLDTFNKKTDPFLG